FGQPLVVREGTFFEGELPHDDALATPAITNAGGVGSIVTRGQGGIAYAGVATTDGFGVAVAMEGVGTGYWVTPLGAPDVTQDDQLLFDLTVDYGRDVPF